VCGVCGGGGGVVTRFLQWFTGTCSRINAMSLIMKIPQNNKWINRIFEAKIAKES
jgi:hypothetical protein